MKRWVLDVNVVYYVAVEKFASKFFNSHIYPLTLSRILEYSNNRNHFFFFFFSNLLCYTIKAIDL